MNGVLPKHTVDFIMNWSCAIINGKLAEVFFEIKGGKIKFIGHCYVKKSEYKTKKEQQYIKQDTAKTKLSYRNGKYIRITS